MHNDRANVRHWQAPPGFVNPVPEQHTPKLPRARAKAKPPSVDLKGMALAFVFFSLVLVVSIAGDSLLERAVTAVKDLTGTEQSAEPASADEWLAADGRSNMPGGLATLSFTPLPGQRELVRSRSVDAPHDGSEWFVSMPDSSETGSNYAVLAYYVFKPPLDTDAAMREARAAEQRNASNMAADPIVFKTIDVDGRRADEFRFTMPGGDRALRVWIFGPVHSFRFDCRVGAGQDRLWRQCDELLESLKLTV